MTRTFEWTKFCVQHTNCILYLVCYVHTLVVLDKIDGVFENKRDNYDEILLFTVQVRNVKWKWKLILLPEWSMDKWAAYTLYMKDCIW